MLTVLLVFSSMCIGMTEEDRLTFNTTDLNGNTVDESILEGYSLILFNVWEPWCGFCVEEMPELEHIYQMYKEQGVLIIGLVNRSPYDGYYPEDEIRETGVTYPILNYCAAFDPYFPEFSFPASLFIDGQGHTIDVKELLMPSMLLTAQADAADYAAGEYDAYLNDPAYAAYQPLFDLLKAAAEGGENDIRALAAYYLEDNYCGTDAFYGSLSNETWEDIFSTLTAR